MTIARTNPASLLNQDSWIEEVWDGMFLERWYAESPLPRITNTRTLDKIKNVGQIINFRIEPEATVVPHIKDQPIAWQSMKGDKRQISVDFAYSAAHRLDRMDKAQLGSLPVMQRIADSITKKHAEKEAEVFFNVMPLMTMNPLNMIDLTGTGAITGTRGSATYAIAQIAKLRTAFNRRRAPKKGRFLVVPPEVEEILIQSDQATFSINGEGNKKAIEDGEWGVKVCGFDIVVSEFVPGDGLSTASAFKCLAGFNGAIGFGRQVTEMESGIKLQDYYGDGIRALNTFGFGPLYPDGIGLWTCKIA
jgi:hypothetical protein